MKLVEFVTSGDPQEPVVVNANYVMAVLTGPEAATTRILMGATSPQTEFVVQGTILEVCRKLTREKK